MSFYTVNSFSDEGCYRLVNGWYKHKAIWQKITPDEDISKVSFKTKASAKASLTKLLKVMPEYASDRIEIARYDEVVTIAGVKTRQTFPEQKNSYNTDLFLDHFVRED